MKKANRELTKHNSTATFLTVFLAILDIKTGELIFANGGHNSPYIQTPEGIIQELDVKKGCLVGALEEAEYENQTLKLFGNERFLLYTDGVTEALNEKDQMFETERLVEVLKKTKNLETKEIIPHVFNEVYQFRGDAKQSDDMTMLAFSYKLGVDKT